MSDSAKPPIASMADSAKIDSKEYRRNGRLAVPEPAWLQIPRAIKIGGAMILLAALIGPAVFGIAVVEQHLLAGAVNDIERDPSCAAPIAQSLVGPCSTQRARVVRTYVDGTGWGAVYHVVVALPRGATADASFVHAPTLYRRMHVGHTITVRMLDGAPFAVGVGDASAAAGDGPLLDRRETWAHVRSGAVSFMLFEVLIAALFLAMKHVRRGIVGAGADKLWT
jgi:hypothetical protein